MSLTADPDGLDKVVAATGRPFRIAMVAPPWFDLPPRGYGGTETIVAALADQLVMRGHHVALLGAGQNRTRAHEFYPLYETPPTGQLGSPMPEVIATAEAARVLAELDVDIVHDHSLAGPLLARGRAVPTVATVHGPATGDNGSYFERLGTTIDVVAISESQRRLNPRINWAGTVHNGVDVASYTFAHGGDYVLWLGRVTPDKGPAIAIDAARAAGRRIVLAGKLNEPAERAHFDQEVRPRLGRGAEWVGEADYRVKRELLAGALCLLFPIRWEEPFGIVMVEALASGTPVVAFRRGSVAEIVRHDVTGVIADDFDAFAAGIGRAVDLDPALCRAAAETRFDLPVMADGYERIYRLLAEGTRSIHSIVSEHDGRSVL